MSVGQKTLSMTDETVQNLTYREKGWETWTEDAE